LKFLSRFESYGLAGWDIGYFTGSRVSPDSALARFDYEHAEAAQLDALAALKSGLHRFEQRLDGHFGLDLCNTGLVGNLVDNV
jgi:hypothetical protein